MKGCPLPASSEVTLPPLGALEIGRKVRTEYGGEKSGNNTRVEVRLKIEVRGEKKKDKVVQKVRKEKKKKKKHVSKHLATLANKQILFTTVQMIYLNV